MRMVKFDKYSGMVPDIPLWDRSKFCRLAEKIVESNR